MKIKNLFKFLFCLLFIPACLEHPDDIPMIDEVGEVDGIKPIYLDPDVIQIYTLVGPKPIVKLGKIYYKDPYIFVNESSKGVHIVDNSDPSAPKKLSFLNIPGNSDIAIKNNFLYADNVRDLVVFDISNINDIQMINRLENFYPSENELIFPSGFTGWFECVDEGKGTQVGWEAAILNNPTCFK